MKKVSEFKGDGEELEALVGVGGSPFLIFPTKVKDPVGGRTYNVPRLKGELPRSLCGYSRSTRRRGCSGSARGTANGAAISSGSIHGTANGSSTTMRFTT